MTTWEMANALTQLAIRSAQQTLALQSEIATELLRIAAEVVGPDEAIRRLQIMARRQSVPPPPDPDRG